MWRDAEKGLAHNNESRDIEEGIRGQIVQIDPIIIHPAEEIGDERVERKP